MEVEIFVGNRANKAVLDIRRLLEWRIPSLIEVGSQRSIREQRLPDPGRHFNDMLCWMLADPLQNIDQVGIRVDALELAGDQQTLDHAHPLPATFGPRK